MDPNPSPRSPVDETAAMDPDVTCCCCFPSNHFKRISDDRTRPESASLWRMGLNALRKAREWSELAAGPRWKTFIRRFNRYSRHAGGGGGGRFGYDPLSYTLNFEGENEDEGFGSRFYGPPGSVEPSVELGGSAPVLFTAPPTVAAAARS